VKSITIPYKRVIAVLSEKKLYLKSKSQAVEPQGMLLAQVKGI